jgi:VWFA-related protein
MHKPLGRKGWLASAILFSAAVYGQTLPPGSLPPGPPPQPGQIGPAPETTAPKTPAKAVPPTGDVTSTEYTTDKDGFRIPVYVRNVLVPTTVLDPDGHGYVNGLQPSEFELVDNGKPQKIQADFVQLPMSVVLVIQANSEVEPVLSTLKKSGVLLHGLVTGQDSDVAVLSYDHRIQTLQDFTSDPDKIDDAMQKLTAGSSSARTIDAVLQGDRMLKQHDPRKSRRRVIVLVSRNYDKGSESKLQETVRQMQFDNVIVYCVDISRAYTAVMKNPDYPRPANGGIPPEALPPVHNGVNDQTTVAQSQTGNVLNAAPPIFRGIHDLFRKTPTEALSVFTGGRMYSFAKLRGFETAITDIGADLNSQYLLSYAPNNSNEPGFHTIKVTVNRPGLVVYTRPGYWTGGGVY